MKSMKSTTKGFTLTELMVVITIIGILMAILLPTMNGVLAGLKLRTATNQLALWFKATRYEAISEAKPETLCIRESKENRVEVATISGSDCESVSSYIPLTGGVRIDRVNSTLRTVAGLAGNKGKIYRVSWSDTAGGVGGSYGQLGKLVLTAGTSKRLCVGLFGVDGSWEIREGDRCLRS